MKNCNMSNMDGVVEESFEVLSGNVPLGNNLIEDYSNEFWEGEGFNNAIGRGKSSLFGKGTMFDKKERARRRSRRENKQDQQQARRNQRTDSMAQSRQMKAQAKLGNVDVQKEMAKGLQDQSGDIALANALASKSPEATTDKKMSTTTKVMIGVGVAVVLGVIGFIVYKKMAKKKP